jgi:chromosome segregation ATPase
MSTLEEPGIAADAPEWRTAFARSLEQQKARAEEIFRSRREKLATLQTDLSCRLAELAEELARDQNSSLERGISLDSQQSAVEASQGELQRQRAEIERQANEFTTLLQQRLAELDAREATAAKLLAEAAMKRAELDERTNKITLLQNGLGEEKAQLGTQRQELAKREQSLARQRRSVAKQLKTRKAELTSEIETLRREASAVPGQDFELQMRCSELQGKCDRLREEASELVEKKEELQERLSTAQQQMAEKQGAWAQTQKHSEQLQARLQKLELQQAELTREREQLKADKSHLAAELEQVREKLERGQPLGEGESSAELQRLRDENKKLEKSLKQAEAAAESAKAAVEQGGSGDSSQEVADLRRRLEMATADCRDLKAKNSELQEQVGKGGSKSEGAAAGGAMDWEAQKRRMLAQLESDFDDTDPAQKAGRMDLEAAMKLTDEAIAAKDKEVSDMRRELDELKGLLENQSSSIGQFAVGASAFAELLDKDELVRSERESLHQMQENLREQLKKAEIDISMERAKIARERAEVDELLHALHQEKAQQVASAPPAGGDKGKKPARGRWLSRLGLSDGEAS